MTLHLFLHMRFIKNAVMGKASREQGFRIVIGIVSLIVLLALAFAPLVSSVDGPVGRPGKQHPYQR